MRSTKKTVSLFQSHVFKHEFFLFPVARSLFPLNFLHIPLNFSVHPLTYLIFDSLRGVAIQNSVHLHILKSSCLPTQENSQNQTGVL